MSEIRNAASNHDDAVRLLQDGELDAVNGGVIGNDGGCIPPFITRENGKIVFHPYPTGPNPWIGR